MKKNYLYVGLIFTFSLILLLFLPGKVLAVELNQVVAQSSVGDKVLEISGDQFYAYDFSCGSSACPYPTSSGWIGKNFNDSSWSTALDSFVTNYNDAQYWWCQVFPVNCHPFGVTQITGPSGFVDRETLLFRKQYTIPAKAGYRIKAVTLDLWSDNNSWAYIDGKFISSAGLNNLQSTTTSPNTAVSYDVSTLSLTGAAMSATDGSYTNQLAIQVSNDAQGEGNPIGLAYKVTAIYEPINNSSCSISAPSNVTAGGQFSASVSLTNSGGTTWTSATNYRLGSQNPQDNSTWGLNRVNLPSTVGPGQSTSFSFTATAPATANTYNFGWQMVQDGVGWFGNICNQTVTVNSLPACRALTVSCSPNPTTVNVNQSTIWTATAVGGCAGDTYSYAWSGDVSGSGPSVTTSYSSSGTKYGSVTVRSSSYPTVAAKTVNCSSPVTVNALPILSCSSVTASPNPVNTGQNVIWSATVTGGSGNYSYSWSGDEGLSGTSSTAGIAYGSAGTKNATLSVSSPGAGSTSCSGSTAVNQPTSYYLPPAPAIQANPICLGPNIPEIYLNWPQAPMVGQVQWVSDGYNWYAMPIQGYYLIQRNGPAGNDLNLLLADTTFQDGYYRLYDPIGGGTVNYANSANMSSGTSYSYSVSYMYTYYITPTYFYYAQYPIGSVTTGSLACNAVPTVNLTVNGAKSTNIYTGQSANLSWSSANADYCYGSGSWGGLKSTGSGSQSTGALSVAGSYGYNLICVNNTSHASAQDSVSVNVSNIPPLAISCSVSPQSLTQPTVGQSTTWSAAVSGGVTPYNIISWPGFFTKDGVTQSYGFNGTSGTSLNWAFSQSGTYSHQVYAQDSFGQNAYNSCAVSVYPLPGSFSFNPLKTACTGPGSPYVDVSWSPSSNVTSYNVYRLQATWTGSQWQYSSWQNLGNTPFTIFRDTNISSGSLYEYYLLALNSYGYTAAGPTSWFQPANCNLTVSCSAQPSPAFTNQSVAWTATPRGGSGSYVYYSWVGGTLGGRQGQTVSQTYSQAGTYVENCHVVDSSADYANGSSQVSIVSPPDLLATTPVPSLTKPMVGQKIIFNALAVNQGGSSTVVSFSGRFCVDSPRCTAGVIGGDIPPIPPLAAGASSPAVYSPAVWVPQDTNPHNIYFCVDMVPNEQNTTNNCSQPFSIQAGSPPYIQTKGGDVHSNTGISGPTTTP